MLAEEIAVAVAGRAVQQGLNKLEGNKREIVMGVILCAFGVALCVVGFTKLYKAARRESTVSQ